MDVPKDDGIWNSVPESKPYGVSIRYTRKQLQLINHNSHRVRVVLKMFYENTPGDRSWDPRDFVEVLGPNEEKDQQPNPDATSVHLEIDLVGILAPGAAFRNSQEAQANDQYLRIQSRWMLMGAKSHSHRAGPTSLFNMAMAVCMWLTFRDSQSIHKTGRIRLSLCLTFLYPRWRIQMRNQTCNLQIRTKPCHV